MLRSILALVIFAGSFVQAYEIKLLQGSEMTPYLAKFEEMRKEHYKSYPYFYEGPLDEENPSMLVVAQDKEQVVGVLAGKAMSDGVFFLKDLIWQHDGQIEKEMIGALEDRLKGTFKKIIVSEKDDVMFDNFWKCHSFVKLQAPANSMAFWVKTLN